MKKPAYHSALTKPQEGLGKLGFWQKDGNTAFCLDICENTDRHFELCDVFYTELGWRDGIPLFNERAGIRRSFKSYMESVSWMIHKYQ